MTSNRNFLIMLLSLAWLCFSPGISAAENSPRLLEAERTGADAIIENPSIVRESKFPLLPLNPGQIEFLIDNPRVALALAHLYAPFLDNYTLEVRPDHVIHVRDADKLAGDAELFDVSPGRRGYLITGFFNVFSIRFNGRMVLMTIYSEHRTNEGATVDATTTAYIKIDSAVASAFARLANFLFPHKVDARINRFVRAALAIVAAVHKDPSRAYRKLEETGEINADELKEFGRMFLAQHSGDAVQVSSP